MEQLFRYEILYYDTCDDTEVKETGILCAKDFGDAAARLTSSNGYGVEHTYKIEIESLGDSIANTDDLKSYALLV